VDGNDYCRIRNQSLELCKPLQTEDYLVQSTPETSPPKWHLAHTTWFFETFILRDFVKDYKIYRPEFPHLFNSYYNSRGSYLLKSQRGLLSRPSLEEIIDYRKNIDDQILNLPTNLMESKEVQDRIRVGLQHEQQHQELLLMDIKCNFALNPLQPAYCSSKIYLISKSIEPLWWKNFPSCLTAIGCDPDSSFFKYDNECPRHEVKIEAFLLADRLITNGEYLEFIEDGGYQRPELWLSDGWNFVRSHQIDSPFYWKHDRKFWRTYSLDGDFEICDNEPVGHISYYEADAFARWKEARLPTEAEWEYASGSAVLTETENFLETKLFHPRQAQSETPTCLRQMAGDLWEWTASAYSAYPNFRPSAGSIGEYNAKFMCNQMVLRGGSFATARTHYRHSYRNYYYPYDRWAFCGIRLARDI